MKVPRLVPFVIVIGLITCLTTCAEARRPPVKIKPAEKEKLTERNDVGDVNQEVTALQFLYYLQATPAQVEVLGKLAATTAPKPGPRKAVAISDKYAKVLTNLRDALAANDDGKVERHTSELAEVQEKESPEFDDVEITDEARKAAGGFVKKLGSRQVLGYLAGLVEDFPDPVDILAGGLEQSRKLEGKEWREVRDDTAHQLGWLLAGMDDAGEAKIREQVTALLNKAAAMDKKTYEAERGDLEKAARELASKVGPTDVLRHYVERTVAEILSNPRLPAAIELRTKKKPTPP